jgi:hypothetical protein
MKSDENEILVKLEQLQQLPGHNPSEAELQRFLLFAVAVAGKTAKQIDKALDEFLSFEPAFPLPFLCISRMIDRNLLFSNVKRSKLGQYHKLDRAYREIVKQWRAGQLDLFRCRPEELETIYGIGPKTSRFFVLHSRPGERYAVLDTHILKWLGNLGIKAPKSTPTGRRYQELESDFLRIADDLKVSPAELDASIWQSYARQ